jgi:hypothetical protein
VANFPGQRKSYHRVFYETHDPQVCSDASRGFTKRWSVSIMTPFKAVLLICLSINLARGCDYSACLCWNADIICSLKDDIRPQFTTVEKISVDSIFITKRQVNWIKDACKDFPRLTSVHMSDGSKCPDNLCVPCG